jgi:DNA-binding transcriptional LysR family regulator
MQINQLRYMIAAAHYGNFSKAAQELYVTQPTLSQQIHKLEEELGTALFFRHSKSVSLTDAGKEFHTYACRVLNDTDQILLQMNGYRTLQRGSIRLGVFWLFTFLGLADTLHSFNIDYPGLTLHLQLDGSIHLLKKLHQHELDAAIVICKPPKQDNSEFFYELLQHDIIAVMVNRENPLSQKEFLTIQDLEGENVIMPAKDTPLRNTIQTLQAASGVHFHVVCESSHNEINSHMVSQNFAISFSSVSVAEKMNDNTYCIVPFYPNIERDVYLVTPQYQLDNPAIQRLVEYFAKKTRNVSGNSKI